MVVVQQETQILIQQLRQLFSKHLSPNARLNFVELNLAVSIDSEQKGLTVDHFEKYTIGFELLEAAEV